MVYIGRISTEYYDKLEDYREWYFSKPVTRYLAGRNDRGRNIMYLHGSFAHSVRRKRTIGKCFMKGWY